ncbi:MAG: hemoglobin [Mycobacterium sp.]|jgi:truncated hemoglobin YjbI|nr:hemoglobin [Mycobacterium sp.]
MRRRSTTTTTEVGGHATSVEVVEDCYLRVIADPELASCFDCVDILAIKHHLRSVIADTVGRPEPPHPTDHRIRVSAEQDARVREHLADVLAGIGVAMPPGQVPAAAGGSKPAAWS